MVMLIHAGIEAKVNDVDVDVDVDVDADADADADIDIDADDVGNEKKEGDCTGSYVAIHMESKNIYNSMQKAIVVLMHAVAFLLAAYDVTFFFFCWSTE
jgi:hypothetical protein